MTNTLKIGAIAIGALLFATSGAYAQLPHPDCAKLPNGGKIKVETPGVIGPATCQACGSGVQIPANFFLGFSDNSHATCELKRPDGTNSGMCRADSQCPPGARRIQQNGVWACQAPSTWVEVSCPAPKAPGTGGGGGRKPEPPACVQQLKTWESKLTQRAAELKTAIGNDAQVRGPAAGEALENTAGASVLMGLLVVGVYTDVLPLAIVAAAKCDDVDRSNAVASSECDKATRDLAYTNDRWMGLYTRFQNAVRRADTAFGQLKSGGDDPGGKAIKAVQDDLKEAQRQVDACVAEVKKWQAPKLPGK